MVAPAAGRAGTLTSRVVASAAGALLLLGLAFLPGWCALLAIVGGRELESAAVAVPLIAVAWAVLAWRRDARPDDVTDRLAIPIAVATLAGLVVAEIGRAHV